MIKKYIRLAGPSVVGIGGIATEKNVEFSMEETALHPQVIKEFNIVEAKPKKPQKGGNN